MSPWKTLAASSLITLAALTGCAGSGHADGDGNTAEAQSAHVALTDDQLAAAIAAAPKDLSEAAAKRLIDETLDPVLTTARLKMLNDFVPTISDTSNTGLYLAGAMEGIVWGTPRDLTSAPAGFGGQHFKTTIDVDSGIAGPTRLTVVGVASADYTLDFTISGFPVTDVKIPKGSNEVATANLIAAALEKANAKIMKTIGDDKTFAPLGGDHSDSQSGVDDLEISTSRGTVVIVVAQNG